MRGRADEMRLNFVKPRVPWDQPGGEKSRKQRGKRGRTTIEKRTETVEYGVDVQIEIMTATFSREIEPIGFARHAKGGMRTYVHTCT